MADPALGVAGVDAGVVHLGDDGGGAGDHGRLALGAGHTAEARGDEQLSGQILVVGDAQLQPAGVQQGVESAVDDALGPDVHPAAGGHLAVVRYAQSRRPIEVLLIVEGAHHEAVGDDDPGGQLMGVEEAQGMAGHDHQGLLVGQGFQVLLDEAILHPVLADLAGLTVGGELVGVERHVEVQVVVDHDLDSLALDAVALILVDGLAVELAGGTEAVAVDAAVFLQLLSELFGHLFMMVGMDVTKSVLDGQGLVGLGQMGFPAGRPAVPRLQGGVFGKLVIQGKSFCRVEISHPCVLSFERL